MGSLPTSLWAIHLPVQSTERMEGTVFVKGETYGVTITSSAYEGSAYESPGVFSLSYTVFVCCSCQNDPVKSGKCLYLLIFLGCFAIFSSTGATTFASVKRCVDEVRGQLITPRKTRKEYNMKTKLVLAMTLISVLVLVLPLAGLAQSKPINIALVNPIQIFPEDNAIQGIRINFIYGKNVSMAGLDWGLANQ